MSSKETDKKIKETKELLFEAYGFTSYNEAESYKDNFNDNIRFYLLSRYFVFEIKTKIVDPPSKALFISIAIASSSAMGTSLTISDYKFDFHNKLNDYNDKLKNILNLLEYAHSIKIQDVSFLLYVMVLDSLVDNSEKRELDSSKTDSINKVIAFIDSEINDSGIKKTFKTQINNVATIGSRNAINNLIKMHCAGKKIEVPTKGFLSYRKIFNECYEFRNKYVHDGVLSDEYALYLGSLQTITHELVASVYASNSK
jgi:hypothetical protein